MTPRARNHAFTLIETIAVILIVGLLAGVVGPLMVGAADAYAGARDDRRATEDASFALDRIVRILREAPEADTPGTPAFTKTTSSGFAFADGTQIILSDTDLMMQIGAGAFAPLCRDVTDFELTYLRADGLPLDTPGGDDASDTRRVMIRLVADGQDLRTCVFLRLPPEEE